MNQLFNKKSLLTNEKETDPVIPFAGRTMAVPRSKSFVNEAYNFDDDDDDDDEDLDDEHGTAFTPYDPIGAETLSPLYANHQPSVDTMFDAYNHSPRTNLNNSHLNSKENDNLLQNNENLADDDKQTHPPSRSHRGNDEETIKAWDRFITLPPPDDDETLNGEWVEIAIKWLKIAAYAFTFVAVLALAVASKSLTLLMTSMIQANHNISICNTDRTYAISPPLDNDKEYNVQIKAMSQERITWLWALYMATVAPMVFAFFRAARICYFKTVTICKWSTLAVVSSRARVH